MTLDEAIALKTFRNSCNCGGYAYGMSMRSMSDHPHMSWCAQFEEWEEWAKHLRSVGKDPHRP